MARTPAATTGTRPQKVTRPAPAVLAPKPKPEPEPAMSKPASHSVHDDDWTSF
jgi:hypothetical protein